MKNRMSPGAKPMAPQWLLLSLAFVFLIGLRSQVASAEDIIINDVNHIHDVIDDDLDDDTDDDYDRETIYSGLNARFLEHPEDDEEMNDEELEDMIQARQILLENRNTNLINATAYGSTYVEAGFTYCFQSHDDFGNMPYPNSYRIYWYFVPAPDVYKLKIHCYHLRIQWATCCQKDKFIISEVPSNKRVRRCGWLHGFWKVYYETTLRIVFKTDSLVRKSGFRCYITGCKRPPTTTTTTPTTTTTTTTTPTTTTTTPTTTTTSTSTSTTATSTTTTVDPCCPCCPHFPPAVPSPAVRQVVNSCADILPGFANCTCSDYSFGICLTCYFCTNCDSAFFAVHDFSNVDLYIYFTTVCPNCIVDLATYSYGFELSVQRLIYCYVQPSNLIMPTFDSTVSRAFLNCDPNIDYCLILSIGVSRKRDNMELASTINFDNAVGAPVQRQLQSLAHLPSTATDITLYQLAADLSTYPNPAILLTLYIDDTPCHMLSQRPADLTAFTSLETLTLVLCWQSVPCNSILLNSASISSVTVYANTAVCDPSCIVSNSATPTPSPSVTCNP